VDEETIHAVLKNSGYASATSDRLFRVGEERLTLIFFCSGYHVMNNTCIYMKGEIQNIYMYRRERIYKELAKKYNNRKA
jgi:hypothetical protein